MMLTSFLMISIFTLTNVEVKDSENVVMMLENYVIAQYSYGPDHPQMRKRRNKIENTIKTDFQLNKRQIQLRFEELVTERKSLLQTKGLTHPATLENAARLSVSTQLLAGKPVAAVYRHIIETMNRD